MRIILASRSPRRKKILKELNVDFKVVVPKIKEETDYKKPHLIVQDLAYKKAISVAKRYPTTPVIAADTIVFCNKKLIGKPKDRKDAIRILKIQSGRWQKVYTGVCLVLLSKKIVLKDYEKSLCYMRKLTEDEIKKISTKHHDKAGGWAVQDKNDKIITKIIGDYTNVVGFPKKIVKKFLSRIKNEI